ncbi:MAG TPA: glycosyltransferase family 39 protein, partial [Chloroflexota bacterium]
MANRRVAPPRLLAALAGLLLLTFGLRVAGLETQSIWVDEGFSIDFSSRTASDMLAMWKGRGGVAAITDMQAAQAASDPLAIAVDIHPPLYYLILHEWLPLAGRGEYAVRFPSVIVGTLLVLLLYTLGAGLVGRGVGLAAAGVGGIAPFYIAYSQEARMYAPVALLGGFSLYFCWRTMATSRQASGIRRQWFIWLGLVVSSSLALYTHYSAVLVIGAENALVAVALLAEVARRRPWARLLIAWASSQLVELALFFPWLRTTIGQVAKYNENLWVPNWQHELTETFRAFDAGLWLPSDESLRLAMAVSVILLAGLAAAGWLWRSSVRRAMPPLPLMAGAAPAAEAIAAPLVARAPRPLRQPAPRSRFGRGLLFGAGALLLQTAVALAAFQVRPEFHPRYLMVLATPYYLLLGLALAALWRRWRPAGLLAGAGLAAIFAVGLRGY